jgi:hypothetical protein
MKAKKCPVCGKKSLVEFDNGSVKCVSCWNSPVEKAPELPEGVWFGGYLYKDAEAVEMVSHLG